MKKRTRWIILISVIVIIIYSGVDVIINHKYKTPVSGDTSESDTNPEYDYWNEIKKTTKNNAITFILLGITGTAFLVGKIKNKNQENMDDSINNNEEE